MYFRNELLALDESILVKLFMQVIFIPHIYHIYITEITYGYNAYVKD